MNTNELISNSIANIRFPMIVGIVMIHGSIPDKGNQYFESVQTILSKLITSPCVPLFFLISAFLFFWNIKEFSKSTYVIKLKKRARTLLLPYLIWNSIAIIIFACLHLFLPSLINSEFENVPKWGLLNYLNAFWKGSGGYPICYQLWFLRDLIVMTFLTPFFYISAYCIGRGRWFILIVLAVLHICGVSGFFMGAFYFYLGALFSRIDIQKFILQNLRKLYSLIMLLAGAVFLMCMSFTLYSENNHMFVEAIMRFSGTVVYAYLFMMFTNKGLCLPNVLENSCFFIYLYHTLFLMVFSRVLVSYIQPHTTTMLMITYFFNVIMTVVVGVIVYVSMKRLIPKFTDILTGGR